MASSGPTHPVHSAETADRLPKEKYHYYTDYKQCTVRAINEGFLTTLGTAVIVFGLQWPFRKHFKRPGYMILPPVLLSTILGGVTTFYKARICSERWQELESAYGALRPQGRNTNSLATEYGKDTK